MEIQFDFSSTTRIVFGSGKVSEVGAAVAGMGEKAFVVAGFHGKDLDQLTFWLEKSQVSWETYVATGEPTVETIRQAREAARVTGCDIVIGFGGGSAIDTGKAVAAMLTNPGDILDYLEVVGSNLPLQSPPLPYIAVPTTAGTGSEVTHNAVIAVPEKHVKVSLRSSMMVARLAIVDPQLTLSLPPSITASTGMDALTQVIEPYVSKRSNALVDIFCREGIIKSARSLLRAYQVGKDENAREDMAFASLMGGLALANAGLGAVHGFAGPVGGKFSAPHGAVCACLLLPVVIVNTRALAEREPNHPALEKYKQVAQMVTGKSSATISDLSRWLDDLRLSLDIPPLNKYGVTIPDLDELVEKSAVASSMKANPVVLLREELREILEMAL